MENVFLVDHPQTPAFAMQAFGYFSRTQRTRLEPNYHHKEIPINIRTLGQTMRQQKRQSWHLPGDNRCISTIAALKCHILNLSDEWASTQNIENRNAICIFTDASSKNLSLSQTTQACNPELFKRVSSHTNVAEAAACSGIDNTMTSRAPPRGSSDNHKINDHISTILDILANRFKDTNILKCDMLSASNVADTLARDCDLTSEDFTRRLAESCATAKISTRNGKLGSRWLGRHQE
jgi:hypothetical protein